MQPVLVIKFSSAVKQLVAAGYTQHVTREHGEAHNKPELPVTGELMRQYRAKIKEIEKRPIRKALEATQRKKVRLKKRLEKVKKVEEG